MCAHAQQPPIASDEVIGIGSNRRPKDTVIFRVVRDAGHRFVRLHMFCLLVHKRDRERSINVVGPLEKVWSSPDARDVFDDVCGEENGYISGPPTIYELDRRAIALEKT